DLLAVELRANRGDVIVEDVLFVDGATCARVAFAERVDDLRVRFRQRRAAVPRFEFDAVVLRRIVACGDDDAAEDFAMKCRERDRLRWRPRSATDHPI